MSGSERTRELEVLEETVGTDWLEQRLRVPPGLDCLEGHFPGLPLLPGVAQLAWAVHAARRLAPDPDVPASVWRIEALKFRELLRPGDVFTARAERRPEPEAGSAPGPDPAGGGDRARLSFELQREGRPAASGRLRLGPEPVGDSLGRVEVVEPASANELPVRELIPHAGPMVFVDELIAGSRERTLCGLRVERLSLFRDPDGSLPGWAGIEPMAQCIAAHGGLEARRRGGEPRVGFLLGCRRLELRATRLAPGVDYAVSARQVWGGEEGLVSFDCELFERRGGGRLLAGRLNAYLPAENDLDGDGLDKALEGAPGG